MRPRYLYFFTSAVAATPGRFFPLFYNRQGLTTAHIGLLLSLQTIFANVTTPLFSHRSDVSRNRHRVLIYMQLISSAFFLSQIPFIPSLQLFPKSICLPYLFIAGLCYGSFFAPIETIVRGIVFAYLGQQNYLNFGNERLWGAVSWALVSMLMGILCDLPTFSLPAVYIAHIVISLCFIACAVISERQIPQEQTSPLLATDNVNERQSHSHAFSFLSAIRPVVFKGGLTTFLFFNLVFWFGYGISVVENLLFLYLVNNLHASNTLCGLSVVLSIVVEVPMYAYTPYLLRVTSPHAVLVIAALAYVIRVVGYAFSSSARAILAFELLHGITFATADAAFVTLIAHRGIPGTESSVQAVYSVVRSIGMSTGSALGGIALQDFGAKWLYLSAAGIVFVATAIFSIASMIKIRQGDTGWSFQTHRIDIDRTEGRAVEKIGDDEGCMNKEKRSRGQSEKSALFSTT